MAVNWITEAGVIDGANELENYNFRLNAISTTSSISSLTLISGSLPPGLNFSNGQISGTPEAVGTLSTYRFVVRARDNADYFRDRTFEIVLSGQRSVDLRPDVLDQLVYQLPSYLESTYVYQPLEYFSPNSARAASFTITSGSLPRGLRLNANTGVIYGYTQRTSVNTAANLGINVSPIVNAIPPSTYTFDGDLFDYRAFSVTEDSISMTSRFTVTMSDGFSSDSKQYTMLVVAGQQLRTDTDIPGGQNRYDTITADSETITTDTDYTRVFAPIILTPPGTLATVRQNRRFLHQIEFIDPEFIGEDPSVLSPSSQATVSITTGSLPPGLFLKPNGWITGLVRPSSLTERNYTFTVRARKPASVTSNTGGNLMINSSPVTYTIVVEGQVESEVDWVTNSNLGTIYSGAISELSIQARSRSGQSLRYELVNGGWGAMPPGLTLLADGSISGRPSFDIPSGTTFTFRVSVNDNGVSVYQEREFTLTVLQRSTTPYDNLYIQYQGTREQRNILKSVIDSTEYIPEDYLYRAYDPWFGKNLTYRILFMTGLTPVSLNTWATTLLNTKNNYYKTLTLGDLKVARALDDNFNVIYEVIYADVIDTAVNAQGLSASREVTSAGSGVTVFPNSFENSAAAIGDDLGFSTRSVLPRWMSSKQVDGSVPGFRRVMVLAYLKPGRGAEVLFRLRDIKSQLVNATFSYSGYNLDNYLSSRWLATSSFPSSSFISANGNITANTLSNVVTGVNKITPLTGTGTVRGVNISNDPTQSLFVLALVGTGTNFANRVHPGDTLTWSDGTTVTTIGVIKSVRSNTLVTFEENPNTSLAGVGNLSCIESTNFINEVTVGDVIRANNTVIGTVANIVSANSLILTTNAQANITNFEFEHTRRDSYNVPLTSDKYITFANIGVLS